MFRSAVAVCFLCLVLHAGAQSQRVYLAPDDHTDYMWTADEETYRRVMVEMLDYYLDLGAKTNNSPANLQSRWNADGTLWLHAYETSKPRAEFDRLMGQVREGRVGVPMTTVQSLYGAMPTEAVLRSMYYAGRLERRYGFRFRLALAMENQTLPYGLGMLWAGSGAQYSWKGICGCATKLTDKSARRPHEIYWWAGRDGSRVLMKWNSLWQGSNDHLGGYAEARRPKEALSFLSSNAQFRAAWPYSISAAFGQGWDDLKTTSDEFVRLAREESRPDREVVVSNQEDFFRDFEQHYGKTLPAYAAAFGNEWDLYTASLAEVSARVRRAVEKMRGAEAMASLVHLRDRDFWRGFEADRRRAELALGLYYEHDWTADGELISRGARAQWQRRMTAEIENYVNRLHADSAYRLGSLISAPPGSRRFYVFNPLGWTRSDVADVLLDADDGEQVHAVHAATGAAVPSQLVLRSDSDYQRPRRYLRLLAADVPAVGYSVYEIRSGPGPTFTPALSVNGNTIENRFYSVRVEERGAISSLVDKERAHREFAQSLNDLGAGAGTLEVENAGPVTVTLRARTLSPVAHTTRITLIRDLSRIDVQNEITENFGQTLEWGYRFRMRNPVVRHEEVGAVLTARLLADGGEYAPTHSRLDWLTLNHFADMSGEDGGGITLSSADLSFMRVGNSRIDDGRSVLDTGTPSIAVLAGGQVDGPSLGLPQQGGDSHFTQRFAIRTHGGFDAADAMRFALEHQNPLIADRIRGGEGYPATGYSLVQASKGTALLWHLKPGEEEGLTVRLWNLGATEQSVRVTLDGGVASAKRLSHIETPIGSSEVNSAALAVTLAAHQLSTFGLVPVPPTSR